MKPRLLDLFCGAGGCTKGYQRVGFYVVGVDITPQPNYCGDEFVQASALDVLNKMRMSGAAAVLNHARFDAIHASPPCQAFTKAQRLQNNEHPDLIAPTRELLDAIGLPCVIENVEGAPLKEPVMLCGTMVGLPLYRHRLFETNWSLPQPLHGEHWLKQVKMGRKPRPGELHQPVGHFTDAVGAREAMGTPWMTRDEMAEAIPPAYTEFIGEQLLAHVNVASPLATSGGAP